MDEAIAKQQKPEKKAKDFTFAEGRRAKSFIGRLWLKRPDGAVVFFSSGSYPPKNLESFRAWADGIYQIQVTGYGYQTPDPIPFALYSGSFGRNPDSRLHGHFSVPPTKPTTVDLKIYLRRNDTLRINPYGISGGGELRKKGPKAYKGPGMAIQKVKVEGPFIEQWPGKGHRLLFGNLAVKEIEPANPRIKKRSNYQPKFKIVANDPVGDAEKLLRGFLPVAFRRPVADHKIPPYLQLIKSQLAKRDGFEQAMRTEYAAV